MSNKDKDKDNMNNKDKLIICKKYNDQLWRCIESHNYNIKYCGKHYYEFYKCFNNIYY